MNLFNPRFFGNQRGAALVEFALVLPLLLLLLFGIIEFSLLMYNKQIMTNASREGARYGIVATGGVRRDLAQIRNEVKNWAAGKLITFGTDTLDDDDIKVAHCSGSCTTWVEPFDPVGRIFGDRLKVRIEYDYDFLFVPNIPLFGAGSNLPGSITLDTETVMNYE